MKIKNLDTCTKQDLSSLGKFITYLDDFTTLLAIYRCAKYLTTSINDRLISEASSHAPALYANLFLCWSLYTELVGRNVCTLVVRLH